MIKFFRQIRRSLLSEGKTGKYLKYAIGEILLVMAGILLALQVNNWNENRKAQNIEKQVLRSLYHDLELNKSRLIDLLELYEEDERRLIYFIDLIWKKNLNQSEANDLVKFNGFDLSDLRINRTTYDEMISTGKLYNISNPLLKEKVIEFYKHIDKNIYYSRQDRKEFGEVFYDFNQMTDFWIAHYDKQNEALVYQFANNQDSPTYKNLKVMAKYSLTMCQNLKRGIRDLLEQNIDLLERINNELANSKTNNGQTTKGETKILKQPKDMFTTDLTIDEIVKTLETQDKSNPGYDISGRAIHRLTQLYMRDERYTDALKICELNINLNPETPGTYNDYGKCLVKLGDIANAKKAFEKAFELNPDFINPKVELYHLNKQNTSNTQ